MVAEIEGGRMSAIDWVYCFLLVGSLVTGIFCGIAIIIALLRLDFSALIIFLAFFSVSFLIGYFIKKKAIE